MSDIKTSISKISALEELTRKDTPIHRLHPTVKLLSTLLYLLAVISFEPMEIGGLIPFVFYPVLLMTIGDIPFRPLFGRLVLTLPFVLFAGLSNLLVSREPAFYLGGFVVTEGMLSFVSIILKAVLTVLAVLILIATTGMPELLMVMVQLKLSSLLILQLTMTFRYLGVLIEEAQVMYHAYILRAPREKGIKLKDMGSFLGQLIIRSFDRAERIYHAMKCRGFEGVIHFSKHKKIPIYGYIYLMIVGVLVILLRVNNFSNIVGTLLIK